MPKTLRSSEQLQFLELLRGARRAAGLSQQELADRLDRPQSFVAKYENGERRIDVIEFVALARALDVAPIKLFRKFVEGATLETSEADRRARRQRSGGK